MLKEAKYPCGIYRFLATCSEFHKVVYLIKDNCCYFSGIGKSTSTINAAEDIIKSIAEKEMVPIQSLTYFDIQTHNGYEGKLPGWCQIDKLEVEIYQIEPSVVSWKKVNIPDNILEKFREYIGRDLKNIYPKVEFESEGLIAVRNENDECLYVHPDGTPAFTEKYRDMSPFSDGLAWVTKGDDKWFQINKEGTIKSRLFNGSEIFSSKLGTTNILV